MQFLLSQPAVSPKALLLLAHGAGAPMDTPFMQHIAEGLAVHGIAVMRFEFPYMAERRISGRKRPPDRMPVLEESFMAAIQQATPQLAEWRCPLWLGGKSMGGRVATHIARSSAAAGVICLGYPFHPPGKPERLRIDHLNDFPLPLLIVQGDRDTLGSLPEVTGYPLSAGTSVKWLTDGDHSFKPRKKSGVTLDNNLDAAVKAVAEFIVR